MYILPHYSQNCNAFFAFLSANRRKNAVLRAKTASRKPKMCDFSKTNRPDDPFRLPGRENHAAMHLRIALSTRCIALRDHVIARTGGIIFVAFFHFLGTAAPVIMKLFGILIADIAVRRRLLRRSVL